MLDLNSSKEVETFEIELETGLAAYIWNFLFRIRMLIVIFDDDVSNYLVYICKRGMTLVTRPRYVTNRLYFDERVSTY